MAQPQTHLFNPSILREYDIRGRVGETLTENDAFFLGLSFGTFVQRQKNDPGAKCRICVGYDGRLTSPALSEALIKGLLQSGVNTQDIGRGPTPMLYFAVKDTGADAGIMVTGSHNPPPDNGFKMMLLNAPVYGKMIQEIGKIAAAGDYKSGEGSHQKTDLQDDYIKRLLKDFTGDKPLKVAWDAGHGATGEIMKRITKKLPGEHILLFEEIDGNFPAHHPDPTVDKNLIDLQQTVLENNCDLGLAFDGDGDRIGVVDEKGNILRCDILMTLYAREILDRQPGAPIIGDVKCSQVMFDEIDRLGGQAVIWKTGHSLVKAKMAELKAPLGGELSGHIFFADKYYGFDDALYCAIRLLNIICDAEGPLSSLTADLPRLYNTPEARFEVNEDEKFDLIPRIIENLGDDDNANLSTIDGIRLQDKNGWWLLRASNTQSALVARAESPTPEGLEQLKKRVIQEMDRLGYDVKFPE